MSGRGGVRSSARLSGDGIAAAGAAAPGPTVRVPLGRGRPVATSAAAALRRARAAERTREVEDSPRVLRDKCRRLARALRNAKHLVVYTGAGISTAADIPDYRGPDGVWTRLRRGEAVARVEVARARPTFTHMALSALWARGALKFVVSQNCDGLHLRAGLPRRALAELHGDMFCELCAPCRRVYLRAFDTTERTARHAHGTRRLCHACGAELQDSIVHFGERGRAAWPLNWAGALRHAARADVVLCLGSSLKVLRRYPRLWRMHAAPRDRPALYIVNLQWTPKDSVAKLKINARCDAVMQQVARRLRLRVPRYCAARDPLLAHAEPLLPPERHTTRHVPLARPPLASSDEASSSEEPSSPSASDSDEELPLRRLADRLRAPELPPDEPPDEPPDRPPDRPPDETPNRPPDRPPDRLPNESPDRPPDRSLRAFQVNLETGQATILLHAEHAPSPPPPGPRSCTADLRRFRMTPLVNGRGSLVSPHDDAKPVNGTADIDSKLRRLLEYEPRIDANEIPKEPRDALGAYASATDVKIEPKSEAKIEPKAEAKESVKRSASSSDEERGSLAAAIFRRAVLLCRASLYPGLHTILAPAAPARADCAWCERTFAARRCLWYGPPRDTALAARAWRRERARRYLCACCGAAGDPPHSAPHPAPHSAPHPAPHPAPEPALDDGGWYGKGYRKGRRRRR